VFSFGRSSDFLTRPSLALLALVTSIGPTQGQVFCFSSFDPALFCLASPGCPAELSFVVARLAFPRCALPATCSPLQPLVSPLFRFASSLYRNSLGFHFSLPAHRYRLWSAGRAHRVRAPLALAMLLFAIFSLAFWPCLFLALLASPASLWTAPSPPVSDRLGSSTAY